MKKLNKRGFLSLLNLIIILAILSLVSACGGGGGGDEATDLTGIHSITLEADATTLNAGQRTTVTAIVTDGTGAVVTGEEVTFSIPTNPSGATIAAVSGTTDANGIATATYTAGSNLPTTTVDDIIQASTSNATKSLIITRAAGDGSTTPTAGLSLTAASTSLKAGGETFLTATLIDETGNPVTGQAVVFSISTNNSGATITTMSGTTDYNGQATARYTAGNLFSTVPLQDTVQATSGTYTRSVIITRTAAAAGSVIYIEADETTLAAGESTQITATVKDDTGALVTGQAVTFGYVTAPPSGAGNLQVVGTGTTDADGQATAIYTAGSANATLKVQDIIRVSIPASAKAVIITRTAAAGSSETAYNLSITASPTSLKIGKNSIITATLTSGSGAAANGKTIAFAFVGTAASGAANPVVLNGGVTDANGRAYAIYTAGANTPTSNLEDIIGATYTYTDGVATAAVILTREASPITPTGYNISLTASVTSLKAQQYSILTASVKDATGNAANNQAVTFSFVGTAASGAAPPVVLNGGVTDANGNAYAVYTPGANLPTEDLQDTIQASVTGATAAIIITRSGTASASTVPPGYIITLTPEKTSLKTGEKSILTAIVKDGSGNLVSGLRVTFETLLPSPSGALAPTVVNGTTDASGQATAIFTAGSTSPTLEVQDTVKASVNSGGYYAASAAIITRVASTAVPQAGYMLTLTAEKTSLKAGKSSILTATVEDASGNLVSGLTVTFTTLAPSPSGATLSDIDAGTSGLTATGVTDANGRAIAIFTAGSTSPTLEVQDTVSASVTDGTYTAANAIIITREASTATAPAGLRMTLSANLYALNAGKQSIITATVVNSEGNPASNLPVLFGWAPNNSGATRAEINTTTDASGRAVMIYTAGSTGSDEREDVVTASVTDGTYTTAEAVIITRLASSVVPTGLALTLTPTPVSLPANATSLLVARVTNADGTAAAGEEVTFSFTGGSAPSGATLSDIDAGTSGLTSATGVTDINGQAVALYTAGNTSPALSIDDGISATVTGAADVKIIQRLPTVGTGKRIVSFIQTPATTPDEPIGPPWDDVVMKVKVTTDNETTPVVDESVRFTIIYGTGMLTNPNDGTTGGYITSPIDVTTDNNGEAWALFTRPAAGTDDTVIRAQIFGTTNGGDAASIVYWTDVAP